MRASLPGFLALVAFLLGTAPAAAGPLAAPAAPAGAVRHGAQVTTPIPALPAGAHEFELLLLPESGPAIQVSPELPAGVTEVRWRMPRVAGRTARLVLRAGGPGVENESAPSAEFALAPPSAGDLADLARMRTGAALWRGYATGAVPGVAPAHDGSELAAGGAVMPAVTPQDPTVLPEPAGAAAGTNVHFVPHAALPELRPRPRAPAFTPLRN